MAEQRLDAAQVGAVVEEVRRETVPKFVGRDLDRQAGLSPVFGNDVVDAGGRDASADFAQKKGAGVDPRLGAVALNGFERRGAQRTEPLLAAFSEHAGGFGVRVDVFHIHVGQLAEAHAGAVEELEDGRVALGCPSGRLLLGWKRERQAQHLLDLGDCKNDGEFLLLLGELDVEQRIDLPAPAPCEPFEKAAQGGEVQPDGGSPEPALGLLKEVAAKVVGSQLVPRFIAVMATAEIVECVPIVLQGAG